jgi:peptidyl-prolyl cis-trans isomerase C
MSARHIRLGTLLALIVLAGVQPTAAAPAKSAARKAAAEDSNEVLVRIGRTPITRGDVQRRIASMPEQFRSNYSTPEGRQQLLDRLVEERVWLAEATKHGVADRPTVKQQIDQQKRDLLIRTYLNELMAKNPAVSDEDAKAFYDAHSSDYRVPASVNVRHIQTKTEAEAKRVKQWAKAGQDWAALAKKSSTDTLTRGTGGNLGTVTRDGAFGTLGNQPALAESAFTLKEGQIGGPYKTDKGWQVIRVDQIKAESTRPFDQVKPLISRQLGSQRQQDFYREQLDEARRSQGVVPDSSAIKRFMSARRSAREMFNDAQALGPAEQRIEAYQKLLAEYPTSEVSPQAQFMIGFIYSEELKKYEDAEKAFRALLVKYPKAELAPSAQWMIDHMRSEEAPQFIDMAPDSAGAPTKPLSPAIHKGGSRPTAKPGAPPQQQGLKP